MSVCADYVIVSPLHDTSFYREEDTDVLQWLFAFAWRVDVVELLEVTYDFLGLSVAVYMYGRTERYYFEGTDRHLSRLALFLVECQLAIGLEPATESAAQAWKDLGHDDPWSPISMISTDYKARCRAALLVVFGLPPEDGDRAGESWGLLQSILSDYSETLALF